MNHQCNNGIMSHVRSTPAEHTHTHAFPMPIHIGYNVVGLLEAKPPAARADPSTKNIKMQMTKSNKWEKRK